MIVPLRCQNSTFLTFAKRTRGSTTAGQLSKTNNCLNQLKNPVSSQSLPLQPNMKKKLSFGEDLTAEYKNGQSSLDQESKQVQTKVWFVRWSAAFVGGLCRSWKEEKQVCSSNPSAVWVPFKTSPTDTSGKTLETKINNLPVTTQ